MTIVTASGTDCKLNEKHEVSSDEDALSNSSVIFSRTGVRAGDRGGRKFFEHKYGRSGKRMKLSSRASAES
jgi:hypothetical protein